MGENKGGSDGGLPALADENGEVEVAKEEGKNIFAASNTDSSTFLGSPSSSGRGKVDRDFSFNSPSLRGTRGVGRRGGSRENPGGINIGNRIAPVKEPGRRKGRVL